VDHWYLSNAAMTLATVAETIPALLANVNSLAPNLFGASSELASVMEFGFKRLHDSYRVHACVPSSDRFSSYCVAAI